MSRKNMPILLVILLFALSSFSQNPAENLLEKTELTFSLNGEPAPQNVGFDNRKSFWKVKYELYLTDFSELEKLGICERDEGNRHICPVIKDKKTNKRIKKKSLKISKGSFKRKSLSIETNREVSVTVNLQPNIIEIFNQATKTAEKNPTFVLFVTETVSVKNSAGAKLKEKYSITGIKQLKTAVSNQTSEYWNLKNMSLHIVLVEQERGRLKLVGGLIH